MKRLLSLLLAVMLVMSTAVPAYATGDGNFDSGGSGYSGWHRIPEK